VVPRPVRRLSHPGPTAGTSRADDRWSERVVPDRGRPPSVRWVRVTKPLEGDPRGAVCWEAVGRHNTCRDLSARR
jgi:hypothetical protein